MAIYHLSMKPISRSGGRSAVAAAAYRASVKLTNERDGQTHDFTHRRGVEHTEIVLPKGAEAEWALDRSRLWNAAEAAEKRQDARVAREFEVALPHELTAGQRLELTREFAHELADRYGVAVDFAIHSPHGDTDVRNHHAHIMLTTRKVGRDGLGEKTSLELENKKLVALSLPTSHDQLRDIRLDWEDRANRHLTLAGHDIRIDHRSHRDRGLEIEPTQHMGVHATQMDRRGKSVVRARQDEDQARRNAELIREKPEQVLTLVTNEKSVFDRADVARALHRYIDGPDDFQAAFAKAMASPALVELRPEQKDDLGRTIEPARYSTKEMIAVERQMADSADRMAESRRFGVSQRHVTQAIGDRPFLAEEQRQAIRHITGPERIEAVVGMAGAGKSTMLGAARRAWEAEGYEVRGAALAGKAADGLEESSGIRSRTLASLERSWERGKDTLNARTVLVIDEAGMVGSRQLSRVLAEADRAGAKVVLVGDPEQLQPIGPGAAFRAIAERTGFAELGEVRRQREGWQRQASVDFARHRTVQGLEAYAERGAIRMPAAVREHRSPDYSEDLGVLGKGLDEIGDQLAKLMKSPALVRTPEELGQAIASAGASMVREAAQRLDRAAQRLNGAAQEAERERVRLSDIIGQARTKNRQFKWLCWTGGVALAVGLILSPFIAAGLPYGLNGRVAALVMWADRWAAGAALMQSANPTAWGRVVADSQLSNDNRVAIDACLTAAARSGKAQRCTVTLRPPARAK